MVSITTDRAPALFITTTSEELNVKVNYRCVKDALSWFFGVDASCTFNGKIHTHCEVGVAGRHHSALQFEHCVEFEHKQAVSRTY